MPLLVIDVSNSWGISKLFLSHIVNARLCRTYMVSVTYLFCTIFSNRLQARFGPVCWPLRYTVIRKDVNDLNIRHNKVDMTTYLYRINIIFRDAWNIYKNKSHTGPWSKHKKKKLFKLLSYNQPTSNQLIKFVKPLLTIIW